MLCYYDDIGLLLFLCIVYNGYWYYDSVVFVCLQWILLLWEFGFGLIQIVDVFGLVMGLVMQGVEQCEVRVFEMYFVLLCEEQIWLVWQIVLVEIIIIVLRGGENFMVENMFDGFDYIWYWEEVEECWGVKVYVDSDSWWCGMIDVE